MKSPRLSITIPTYNRLERLKLTLDTVLPQLTDEVELLVSDNCSQDRTWDYLQQLGGRIRSYRQQSNVGADRNFISCLELAQGEYVWTLCDDDLPCSNAVESILKAIESFKNPPLVYVRCKPSDEQIHNYDSKPVISTWAYKHRNELLSDIREWFTFASSIVARRDCVDLEFLSKQIGSSLVPAAITFSIAGVHDGAVICDQPLLYCRGGNAGGYNAFQVFTKNIAQLLQPGTKMGFERRVLRQVRRSIAENVITYLVKVWPLNIHGLLQLTRYCCTYKVFYTQMLPTLSRRAAGIPFRAIRGALSMARRSVIARYYQRWQEWVDEAANASFQKQVIRLGSSAKVRHPFYLINPHYIQIGYGFLALPGLRIEAWDEYDGTRYTPNIVIGNDVVVNYNVHIGAIGRLEIGNNVLIGSRVLITDHSHGGVTPAELEVTARLRPLVTKGPTIIEDNVWIGEGACILGGVRVGRNAVIGANAVVTKNVGPGEVVGGMPARVLKNSISSTDRNHCGVDGAQFALGYESREWGTR
jgi:acetyltransferase-like isoleucine patch superfamily enzyme